MLTALAPLTAASLLVLRFFLPCVCCLVLSHSTLGALLRNMPSRYKKKYRRERLLPSPRGAPALLPPPLDVLIQ